jgi:two-component system sensor histidine kinase PilS (NtrC family)
MGEPDRSATAERRTLRGLLAARVLAATLLLGSATIARLRAPQTAGPDALFLLLALSFALAAIYAVLIPLAPRHRWLLVVQTGADAVIVAMAVLMTGGVDSLLVPLYVLPVVAAAVVHDRRGGLLVAALNTLSYGAILALQYDIVHMTHSARLGWLLDRAQAPLPDALFTLALNGVGLACVAWLTGYLAERLRHTDERLRQASTQIADLQAFNQCVIDSLTGGLATAGADGRVLTFNVAAGQITGLAAADVRGRPVQDVLQLPASLVEEFPRIGTAGTGIRLEIPYTTRSGRQVDLGLTAAPLTGADGTAGFLFTFQDITERRRRERETQTERRLAAIGEMAAGIAHEIRNPLASMAGSIQVLRQDLELSAEQALLMDIVLRESQRLNATITNFLTYARPQRHASKPVDLAAVLRDAAALLRNSGDCVRDHQVTVHVPDTPCLVGADDAQLRQVVWNLAVNGLKAMPEGGPLNLRLHRLDETWVVVVEDGGVGMAPSVLEHVCEPFRSGFSGGTGLGLSIVHRIVTDLGGSIAFESAPGCGTAVRVSLPAAPGGTESIAGADREVDGEDAVRPVRLSA